MVGMGVKKESHHYFGRLPANRSVQLRFIIGFSWFGGWVSISAPKMAQRGLPLWMDEIHFAPL